MNTRRLASALCIVCAAHLLAIPESPRAQAPAASPETRAARVENGLLPGIVIAGRSLPAKTLAARMAELKTPGVSVAVINGGVIEWAKGYGVTEAGGGNAVTPQILFQAASLSKPVAALAALRLVEQGKLALDEDVNARLTSWKVPENDFTKAEKVTLRRLLSHSAGLTVSGFPGYSAGTTVPALVQVLDGQKPATTAAIRADIVPGTIWRYSGGGYTVMQQLLMDVTGRPFPLLLSEMVLQPIGMTDSTYEQPLPETRRAAAASGHRTDGSLLPGRYHTYPEMAAAGLWTTPTDLARFLIEIQQALQGRSKVLSPAMARQMVTVQKGSYALGLSIEGAGAAAAFGHGGSNAGFKCQMTAFVEGGRGAVVMTNGDQGGRLASEILRAVAVEYRLARAPAEAEDRRHGRALRAGASRGPLRAAAGPRADDRSGGRHAVHSRRRTARRTLPRIGDAVLRTRRGIRFRIRQRTGRGRQPPPDQRPAAGEATLSTAGDGAEHDVGLLPRHDVLRQGRVGRFVRQILAAGIEPDERPPPPCRLVPQRAAQSGPARFDGVDDRALRDGSPDVHRHLAPDAGERPQVSRQHDPDHLSVCTSTERTAGKSRTIGDQWSPASADTYTWPPVVPK